MIIPASVYRVAKNPVAIFEIIYSEIMQTIAIV